MQIGTLVVHESDPNGSMGIVIDESSHAYQDQTGYNMVRVQWLDGMGVGLYWTDELEVICK